MISQNSLLKRAWPVIIQCAQAHRKPRWVPVAKSKLFRVPKRPVVSEEEKIELRRINNNYKTQMRAIRKFYHDDMIVEKSSRESASSELSQRLEAEEWERCVQINEKWNIQIAAEREERRKTELAAMEEHALARMEAKDKKLRNDIAKASEEIRKQKELSTTFITPENLEAAIDHALANPIDYNYVIDLKGAIYTGRDTAIQAPKKEEKSNKA